MLSRRHLRIKVLQGLYAFVQSGNDRLDSGERELMKSLDKLYELFIFQLSFLVELKKFAENRIEEARHKFYPTEQELNPSLKFIQNRILLLLSENRYLQTEKKRLRISWADQKDLIRIVYNKIRESSIYNDYMESSGDSFETDREFLVKLIKRKFSKLESLHYFYEEKYVFWSDDYFLSNLLLIKTINRMDPDVDEYWKFPQLIESQNEKYNEGDIEFIKTLFRKCILRDKEFGELIREKLKNWEMERLAIMDILILKMALVELLECKSIPVKVSLNEYIELSKLFSTPKSKVFINGILDKLITELRDQKKIQKVGLGLIEN